MISKTPDLKGLMTWSANWDGSKGWTFGDDVKRLPGRRPATVRGRTASRPPGGR
ncbi:hypothetical protein [Micromonospora taraxaci]